MEAAPAKRIKTKNTDKTNRAKKVQHQNSVALVLGIICKKDLTKWMSKVRGRESGFPYLGSFVKRNSCLLAGLNRTPRQVGGCQCRVVKSNLGLIVCLQLLDGPVFRSACDESIS